MSASPASLVVAAVTATTLALVALTLIAMWCAAGTTSARGGPRPRCKRGGPSPGVRRDPRDGPAARRRAGGLLARTTTLQVQRGQGAWRDLRQETKGSPFSVLLPGGEEIEVDPSDATIEGGEPEGRATGTTRMLVARVSDGDLVWATGILSSPSSPGAGAYRSGPSQRQLTPPRGGKVVIPAAVAGASLARARVRAPRRRASSCWASGWRCTPPRSAPWTRRSPGTITPSPTWLLDPHRAGHRAVLAGLLALGVAVWARRRLVLRARRPSGASAVAAAPAARGGPPAQPARGGDRPFPHGIVTRIGVQNSLCTPRSTRAARTQSCVPLAPVRVRVLPVPTASAPTTSPSAEFGLTWTTYSQVDPLRLLHRDRGLAAAPLRVLHVDPVGHRGRALRRRRADQGREAQGREVGRARRGVPGQGHEVVQLAVVRRRAPSSRRPCRPLSCFLSFATVALLVASAASFLASEATLAWRDALFA